MSHSEGAILPELFKKNLYIKLLTILFSITFLFIFLFEGKNIEVSVLRYQYIKDLEKFENTP